jgi:hypothetical protein
MTASDAVRVSDLDNDAMAGPLPELAAMSEHAAMLDSDAGLTTEPEEVILIRQIFTVRKQLPEELQHDLHSKLQESDLLMSKDGIPEALRLLLTHNHHAIRLIGGEIFERLIHVDADFARTTCEDLISLVVERMADANEDSRVSFQLTDVLCQMLDAHTGNVAFLPTEAEVRMPYCCWLL